MQQTTVERMWKMLQFNPGPDKPYTEAIPEVADFGLELKRNRSMTEKTWHCRYLNLLSDFVREQRKIPDTMGVIRFDDCSETRVTGHPTGTKATPAFVAVRKAIGEMDPGDDGLDAEAQCVLSTERLLQARPDYISVPGMSVHPDGFKLIASSACGVSCTQLLKWDEQASRRILFTWILYLYDLTNIDDSITLNTMDPVPTFNIQCPGVAYPGCSIRCVGGAFSRRTVIFNTTDPSVVIKEQYVNASRQDEGSILGTIHQSGTFPGVVRVGWHGTIQSGNGQTICVEGDDRVKEKRRLVMLDQAGPLMDAATLRDALIAIYDLLEITRFLYTKRRILHRDISVSNVLLRDVATTVDHSFAGDLQDMCFAAHLLNQKSHAPNAKRLDTRVLLIDFDLSEDVTAVCEGHEHTSRVGTSVFMARVVRDAKYDKGVWKLPPMPQLSEALDAYATSVGDRLEAFPPNGTELIDIEKPELRPPFQHRLRYDTESGFWLLMRWAMLACPENDTSKDGDPS